MQPTLRPLHDNVKWKFKRIWRSNDALISIYPLQTDLVSTKSLIQLKNYHSHFKNVSIQFLTWYNGTIFATDINRQLFSKIISRGNCATLYTHQFRTRSTPTQFYRYYLISNAKQMTNFENIGRQLWYPRLHIGSVWILADLESSTMVISYYKKAPVRWI